MRTFDLVVIGAGPAGEKAAAKAAYFGRSVAIIEALPEPGGAGVHTGTLPSKTLKETALFLSGRSDAGLFGVDRALGRSASIEDFFFRRDFVRRTEVDQINRNLDRHKIEVYKGLGSFEDTHTIRVSTPTSSELIRGDFILIATGSYPFRPSSIPFDDRRVHDSDSILGLDRFPKSLCVIGAGVIGCEYATIFSTLGIPVHLVNSGSQILPFIDHEVSTALLDQMKRDGVTTEFQTEITRVEAGPEAENVRVHLSSGKVIDVDMLLFAAGRSGNTAKLDCARIGLKLGKRETIQVDDQFRTNIPHIFAVGDVVGFPALASTSMDQGRAAVSHMFGLGGHDTLHKVLPYGIYTIPEVSMVGLTEREARAKGLDVECGRSRYEHMARGKILGERNGFMKLVFDKADLGVLGVHIIGTLASEVVHFGIQLVERKTSLNELISVVFNYPTLHDLYKYAAYDGLGNAANRKLKD